MKIGSLFSGYGGLDMAVESVTGASTAWVSDIDKGACKILAHRYPDVPNIGDLTKVDWSAVEPVDIITGGFPCQDLSHAGKGAGMTSDSRSGLWSYMAEAVNIIRPRLVVAENVRGLLSAEALRPVEPCAWCVGDEPDFDVRALGAVLADLADIGYVGRWTGLRAADVGSCHGRFRIFLVAYPRSSGRERIGSAQLAGSCGHTPGNGSPTADTNDQRDDWGGEARDRGGQSADGHSGPVELFGTPTARMWKGSGPVGSASHQWLLDHGNVEAQVLLLPTPAVNDMGAGKTVDDWDVWTAKMKSAHGNGNGNGASLSIEALRLLPTPTAQDSSASGGSTASDVTLTDATVRTRMGTVPNDRLLLTPSVADTQGGRKGRSGDRSDELLLNGLAAEQRFGQYAAAIRRWETVIGRPAPSPTEPTGKGGSPRLSPAFTEWMMGLPTGWITDVPGITRNEALKACGNGVVPQQAAAALRHMLAVSEVAA